MFLIEAKKLQTRLLQRGYSPTRLKKAFRRAKEKTETIYSLINH